MAAVVYFFGISYVDLGIAGGVEVHTVFAAGGVHTGLLVVVHNGLLIVDIGLLKVHTGLLIFHIGLLFVHTGLVMWESTMCLMSSSVKFKQ